MGSRTKPSSSGSNSTRFSDSRLFFRSAMLITVFMKMVGEIKGLFCVDID